MVLSIARKAIFDRICRTLESRTNKYVVTGSLDWPQASPVWYPCVTCSVMFIEAWCSIWSSVCLDVLIITVLGSLNCCLHAGVIVRSWPFVFFVYMVVTWHRYSLWNPQQCWQHVSGTIWRALKQLRVNICSPVSVDTAPGGPQLLLQVAETFVGANTETRLISKHSPTIAHYYMYFNPSCSCPFTPCLVRLHPVMPSQT